jgi:hypothetical protein
MKILAYRSKIDFNFDSIMLAIADTKYEIGYMSTKIDSQVVEKFAPDIIIHNIENVDQFPTKVNAISINLNESMSPNSFSFNNIESHNYLKPFVSIKSTSVPEDEKEYFQSDIVYIGTPAIFHNVLSFLCEANNNINFKFFSDRTHNIKGYCGMCSAEDYLKFYSKAKACLVHKKDITRTMDIIIADGNPIIYENDQQCIQDIKDAIYKNKKFTAHGYNKNHILENDTSYDRASEIFKKVGLTKISEELIKTKKNKLGKK